MVEHPRFLNLSANIGLLCKTCYGANALTHFAAFSIIMKKFYVIGAWRYFRKTFYFVNYISEK
jgi:hypothetical protein